MTPQQKARQFSKFLSNILERHPEEFGLIPDESGFIKIRDLLQALHETDGWRHIRESNLNELMLLENNPPFEMSGGLIRAAERERLPKKTPCREVPKILYTCVRKKAYPHVLEKGVSPAGYTHVICTPDDEMAKRLGQRKDRHAVLLTIHTAKTAEKGVAFHKFADTFYMAEHIPADTFTGPPLPKIPEKEKSPGPAKTPKPQTESGAFFVTPEMIESGAHKKSKGKKKKLDWKQDRKHSRKKEKKSWPDAF